MSWGPGGSGGGGVVDLADEHFEDVLEEKQPDRVAFLIDRPGDVGAVLAQPGKAVLEVGVTGARR